MTDQVAARLDAIEKTHSWVADDNPDLWDDLLWLTGAVRRLSSLLNEEKLVPASFDPVH